MWKRNLAYIIDLKEILINKRSIREKEKKKKKEVSSVAHMVDIN